MKTTSRLIITLTATALAALALAGCSSTSSSPSSTGSSAAPTASAELATASGSFGEIIVDGKGMTAYRFDKDTQNATSSACTGQCAALWPAITTTAAKPQVTGVTGTIGTITGADGGTQITVNGWPIYTYAKDTKAGDAVGQGIGGIWWVLSPAGEKITTPAGKAGY